MMWLDSKVSGGHRSSLLKRILFLLVTVCFLVAFNFVFVGDATEPVDGEHPWDDLCNIDWDQSPSDSTDTDDFFMFPFGFGSGFIFHMWYPGQDDGLEEVKVFGPSQRNRGHLFIDIK